jgi:hypothetical protein
MMGKDSYVLRVFGKLFHVVHFESKTTQEGFYAILHLTELLISTYDGPVREVVTLADGSQAIRLVTKPDLTVVSIAMDHKGPWAKST